MTMANEQMAEVFRFGIYGKRLSSFTTDKQKTLLALPYVEVITPKKYLELQDKFDTKPQPAIDVSSAPIPQDHFVRMNMAAWGQYAFGNRLVIIPQYYILFDFLLQQKQASAAEIRKELGIDAKTLHYLSNKFKQHGNIELYKDSEGQVLVLKGIAAEGTNEANEINDADAIDDSIDDISGMVCYTNMSLYEQIKMHIKDAEQGISARMLENLTGIKSKLGLKLLEKIAAAEPETVCVVSELSYKSRTFRFYWRETYEEAQKIKEDNIRKQMIGERRTSISNADKEVALMTIAEKYKSFVLSKEIMQELKDLTGWAFSFERKTIIKTAKALGLEVEKFTTNGNVFNTRISLTKAPSLSEEASEDTESPQIEQNDKFKRSLYLRYITSSRFTKYDNGYFYDRKFAEKRFYEFLVDEAQYNRLPLVVSGEDMLKLSVNDYYGIFGVRKLMIREIMQNSFKGRSVAEIDEMAMEEYLVNAGGPIEELIKMSASTEKIEKLLRRLEMSGAVELRQVGNSLEICKISNNAEFPDDFSNHSKLTYQSRIEIYQTLSNYELKYLFSDALRLFEENYYDHRVNLIKSTYDIVYAEDAEMKNPPLFQMNEAFYLKIKKMILVGNSRWGSVLEGRTNSEIYNMLNYMSKKRILSNYNSMGSIESIAPSYKLTSKLEIKLNDVPEHKHDEFYGRYFVWIYKVIKTDKSIDMMALVEKLKFLEEFELRKFFDVYSDIFELNTLDSYIIVSLKNDDIF
ncbi:hypothetical protein ENBRE01_1902 [Enteropsectra breve]|nr:hypothetical protein ENBRE01_1902 [Enteropsectra breve]